MLKFKNFLKNEIEIKYFPYSYFHPEVNGVSILVENILALF